MTKALLGANTANCLCGVLFSTSQKAAYNVPLDMKGCICHFVKWQIHPFISKEAINPYSAELVFYVFFCFNWKS